MAALARNTLFSRHLDYLFEETVWTFPFHPARLILKYWRHANRVR